MREILERVVKNDGRIDLFTVGRRRSSGSMPVRDEGAWPQIRAFAIEAHCVVRVHSHPATTLAPEHSHPPLGKPAAMREPTPEVAKLTRHVKTVHRVHDALAPELVEDKVSQAWRDTFVTIQSQHPVTAGFIQGEVFLGHMTLPLALQDSRPEFPGDIHGAILAERVHDDDFVAPRNTLEAGTDVLFLVEGNDASRDRGPLAAARRRNGLALVHAFLAPAAL